MHRTFSLLLMASVLSVASTAWASDAEGDCAKNFAVSGSFFAGKQYKTSASLPGVRTDLAFKKAYAYVVKAGYQVTHSDKEVGVISAAQQVSYSGGGKTAPLNVLIESDANSGTKIALSFLTAGGLSASEDAVRNEFCGIVNDIARK